MAIYRLDPERGAMDMLLRDWDTARRVALTRALQEDREIRITRIAGAGHLSDAGTADPSTGRIRRPARSR